MCVCSRWQLCVCVSCVCSTLSPGTSAMPPLSQFLTSPLKNMLIQTNLLFLLSSPLFSWDGLEETYNHSRRSSPTARAFDFLLPFFLRLYFTIPNHLFPPTDFHEKRWGNLSIGSWCVPAFLCVTLTSQLHRECSLSRGFAGASAHCNVLHFASTNQSLVLLLLQRY